MPPQSLDDVYTRLQHQLGLGAVVILAIVVVLWYVLKVRITKSIEHEYTVNVKNLEHQYNANLKALEHEYDKKLAAHKETLATLSTRQADAIEIIHNGFLKFYGASVAYDRVRPVSIPNAAQKFSRELYDQTFEEFRTDFIKQVIYLPDGTRLKIEAFISEINRKNILFNSMEMAGGIARADGEEVQRFDKAILEIRAKLPTMLEAVREDLQNLLGITKK